MDIRAKQALAVSAFDDLHKSGCFVLPNPWDVGTAVFLEHLGFKALATTSSGFAFSKARRDGPSSMPIELTLQHFAEIAAATSVPVNADFQNGYADKPEDVARNVERCIETGVAGLSIEDSTRDTKEPLYEFNLAVDRVRAARAAIDSSGMRVVLTARCEAWLVDNPDPLPTAVKRLEAFAQAGADCLYAPGVRSPKDIRELVNAVAPKPLNVLIASHNHSLTTSQLNDLGVGRISVGGALASVAMGAFINSAKQIYEQGSFVSFADAAPFASLSKDFD